MFNFFWNWLDPKILRVEAWTNRKVIEWDKIDVDLDRVKKGEVRENDMFRKPIPNDDGGKYGPFLANITGGQVVHYLQGPGAVEAFALIEHDDSLWWRHRDAGTTEDFRHGAFTDMKEFFEYAHGSDNNYWEHVLRTQALKATPENPPNMLLPHEVTDWISEWEKKNATTTA